MAESTTKKDYPEIDEWSKFGAQHWRSWGSWFSWGSPVGLGLFFIALAVTIWILTQAF
jgi:hypothetical protein